MKITPLHEWNLTPQQAIELQKQLAFEVVAEDKFDEPVPETTRLADKMASFRKN